MEAAVWVVCTKQPSRPSGNFRTKARHRVQKPFGAPFFIAFERGGAPFFIAFESGGAPFFIYFWWRLRVKCP
jgi:hypothetical protein